MDVIAWKFQQKAARWWFHIYSIVQEYLESMDQGENDIGSLMSNLQQFMEKSSLGEYTGRLDMLLVFHCQTTNMGTSRQNGKA